jgi:hypothetical protein
MKFAGRVAFESKQGIVAEHAATVIGNANETPAPVLDFHPDTRRTRIERILEQFLDDRRRPLHDLARRNLVCDVVRKDPDATHNSTLNIRRCRQNKIVSFP